MASMSNDFYGSIDRLVEFGLSGQLALSMMQTMNSVMANMQMPNYAVNNKIDMTSPVALPPTNEKRFFMAIDKAPVGPLSMDELAEKEAKEELTKDTLIWYKGLPGWVEAKKLEELTLLFK